MQVCFARIVLNKKREAMKKFFRKCVRCLEILGDYGMQKYGMKRA